MLWKKQKPIRAESAAQILASQDGPATFIASPAYSGGILKVAGYRFGVIMDLAGLSVNKKVVANLDHDIKKRVGHITDHSNDGKSLSLSGVMSADNDHSREVLGSHHQGFSWDVSIEAIPVGKVEMVKAGQTVFVNGQTFQGPVEIARKSNLYGLGFVSIGADVENAVSIAAMEDPEKEDPEKEDPETDGAEQTFEEWAMSHEFDLESMSESELAALQSIFDKQSKAAEPVAASFDANFIRAESQKTNSKIEAAILKYEDSVPAEKLAEIRAEAQAKLRALKARAGEHEYSGIKYRFESTPIIAQTHLALIRAERPQGPAIISSTKDTTMNPNFIQASLHIASGREDLALKACGEQTTEAARKTGPRSLLEVCEVAIRASGAEVPRDRNEMVKMAMRPILAGGFSNVSLPNILSNTMGRTLEQAFLETTDTWRPFVTVKSAADFKPQQSIRPSSAGNMQRVAAGGELKHQQIGEEATYPWQIGTWGTIETITRQDIINDNLGFFNERPTMHGIAAGRTLNDLVWRTIMGFSFVNTMTVSLLIGNLTDAVAKMKTQKDSKGNAIDIALNTLAVPPELEGVARQVLRSAELVTGVAGQGSYNPAFNIVPNLVCEPRLSNSLFPGWAVDNWYLFGGPISSAVIVGYLNNQKTCLNDT
jgi:hypothetical protein